jgi:hypothetical protein
VSRRHKESSGTAAELNAELVVSKIIISFQSRYQTQNKHELLSFSSKRVQAKAKECRLAWHAMSNAKCRFIGHVGFGRDGVADNPMQLSLWRNLRYCASLQLESKFSVAVLFLQRLDFQLHQRNAPLSESC